MAPRIVLVTRHPATIDWFRDNGHAFDEAMPHLSLNTLRRGDTVIGDFPLHLAAEINRRGARVIHFAIDSPGIQRGEELTKAELAASNPRLMPLKVTADTDSPNLFETPRGEGEQTLITLLGAPPKGDYRNIRYRCDDRQHESAWMPDAYIRFTRETRQPFTKLIVIGTSGSSWDLLARIAGIEGSELEFNLYAATERDDVSPRAVQELAEPLARKLGLQSVVPIIVPYSIAAQSTADIAGMIGDHIGRGESVVLDVTFGLRDMVFTVFSMILALESLRGLHLERIIYAAITTQQPEVAEIRNIFAIPEVMSWVRALSVLDVSGDLSPLANLLVDDPAARALITQQQLAEKLLRPRKATRRAKQLLKALERSSSPMARLFRDAAFDRLAWARSGACTSKTQALLALQALNNGSFVQATALAFEACVSRYAEENYACPSEKLDDQTYRRQIQAEMKDDLSGRSGRAKLADSQDMILLRDLRNAMLHASEPQNSQIAEIFDRPELLKKLVRRVCGRLSS